MVCLSGPVSPFHSVTAAVLQLAVAMTMLSMLDDGGSPAAFLWSSKISNVIKMMAKTWILLAVSL